jgi:hypothetical protein
MDPPNGWVGEEKLPAAIGAALLADGTVINAWHFGQRAALPLLSSGTRSI